MLRTPALFHVKKSASVFLQVIFLVILGSYIGSLTIRIAQTQISSQSLEVSPPSQELDADPGKTIVVRAKLRNTSHDTLPIKVHIEDFTASGEEGQVALTNGGTYSVMSWAKITPDHFTLKPGTSQEVEATIAVPTTGAGGRYGSFVFSVTPETKPGNAVVAQEIASLFLLKISGPVTENILLTSFQAPKFSEFGPIPFAMKFTNTGNIHAKTYGLVNVSNMFGRKVEDVVVRGTNIFPGANRVVRANLNRKFMIGNYTATAVMYYGASTNHTLTATTSFFVFPVRLVVAIIIVILLLYAMRKRLKKTLKVLFS